MIMMVMLAAAGLIILLANTTATQVTKASLFNSAGQATIAVFGVVWMSGTFMDYLIPSAMEVPELRIVDHCTPSPLTTFGQKGSGEAGYLGAPAAIANAVNDALGPFGISVDTLPISHLALWEAISAARKNPA